MGHILSVAAEAANNRSDTETRDLIVITLPDPLSPITLRFATADVVVDGVEYLGKLRSVPLLVQSEGGNVDGGTFTISNLSNDYGPTFLDTDRVLDGASVVITRAWLLDDGTWEAEDPVSGLPYELGRGRLVTRPIKDDVIECQFVSDFSDASIEIGGSMISQRCLKCFNVNGNHPDGGPCGWKPTFLHTQVETAIIEGTITTAGNLRVILTAAGMTNSPKTVDVAVASGDNASAIATKIRAALTGNGDVSSFFTLGGIGPAVKVLTKVKQTVDSTMNLNVNNLSSAGLVPLAVSENTSSLFCDKEQDSPEGCSGHGNTRHGGVPGLTPSASDSPINPAQPIGNGGYGPTPYPNKNPYYDIDNRPYHYGH